MKNTSIPKNTIQFRLWGRFALFTDPLTRIGGEKCSYHLPTYEALKGVCKSIYWKPTFVWVVDAVRVMRRIRTQTKGTKPLNYSGVYPSERTPGKKQENFNDLSIYTFLTGVDENAEDPSRENGVEYQVKAHFVWNERHDPLEKDRIDGKHYAIAKRMLKRGGRQDIFLGTRDCQGYVEPCTFGEGKGAYDDDGEISYGLMFHGFDYPDEKKGANELYARFWFPVLKKGILTFPPPEHCEERLRKFVRTMDAKSFGMDNVKSVEIEAEEMGVME
ncbi:MAG: type I-C CRISPR-associated protein Cas5c [Phycisphaerae bacterium]|nr:type I-C CRISPR-associated protein Cas5c [Phycisphaerae bacterium]